jgi:hypothetical protein
LSHPAAPTARAIHKHPTASISEAEARMFQASNAFVSACQEATMAMHALTAKIREMEKKVAPVRKEKIKVSNRKASALSN